MAPKRNCFRRWFSAHLARFVGNDGRIIKRRIVGLLLWDNSGKHLRYEHVFSVSTTVANPKSQTGDVPVDSLVRDLADDPPGLRWNESWNGNESRWLAENNSGSVFLDKLVTILGIRSEEIDTTSD